MFTVTIHKLNTVVPRQTSEYNKNNDDTKSLLFVNVWSLVRPARMLSFNRREHIVDDYTYKYPKLGKKTPMAY